MSKRDDQPEVNRAANPKIALWAAFIAVTLFVGLGTGLGPAHKYLIIGGVFLICLGVFAAIVRHDNPEKK